MKTELEQAIEDSKKADDEKIFEQARADTVKNSPAASKIAKDRLDKAIFKQGKAHAGCSKADLENETPPPQKPDDSTFKV